MKFKMKARQNKKDVFDEIDFIIRNDLIYHVSLERILRLIISAAKKKNIFKLIYDENQHCGFHRIYARLNSIYIRHVDKRLRSYIRYCRICNEKQIKKHVFYNTFNFIKFSILLFHTVILNFVVALSSTSLKMNFILFITDKFFKRIELVLEKII